MVMGCIKVNISVCVGGFPVYFHGGFPSITCHKDIEKRELVF